MTVKMVTSVSRIMLTVVVQLIPPNRKLHRQSEKISAPAVPRGLLVATTRTALKIPSEVTVLIIMRKKSAGETTGSATP